MVSVHGQIPVIDSWVNKDVLHNPDFPRFHPRFCTGQYYEQYIDQNPYRNALHTAQVYTDISRYDYQGRLRQILIGTKEGRTIEVRWRVSKDMPSFSPEFLNLYLSRYGKIVGIYKKTINCCLVTFATGQSVRTVMSTHHIGLPYGKLFIKLWKPSPQDNDFFRVTKHVEKATSTKRRFNALMDRDDHKSFNDMLRNITRGLADNNRKYGPALQPFLCGSLSKSKTT